MKNSRIRLRRIIIVEQICVCFIYIKIERLDNPPKFQEMDVVFTILVNAKTISWSVDELILLGDTAIILCWVKM